MGRVAVLITEYLDEVVHHVAVELVASGFDLSLISAAPVLELQSELFLQHPERRTLFLKADVRRADEVEEALHRTASELGGMDALLCRAGSCDLNGASWRNQQRSADLQDVFGALQAAEEWLLRSRHGRAVILADPAEQEMRHASLLELSQAIAARWAPCGATMNVVVPQCFTAPLVLGPGLGVGGAVVRGRVAWPQEVARVTVFLCQREAGFLSGQLITVAESGWTARRELSSVA